MLSRMPSGCVQIHEHPDRKQLSTPLNDLCVLRVAKACDCRSILELVHCYHDSTLQADAVSKKAVAQHDEEIKKRNSEQTTDLEQQGDGTGADDARDACERESEDVDNPLYCQHSSNFIRDANVTIEKQKQDEDFEHMFHYLEFGVLP